MPIKSFLVNGKNIFINNFNGMFSYDLYFLKEYEGYQILAPNTYSRTLYKCINICIQISNNCNMNCLYCFASKNNDAILSNREIKKYLDYMFDYFVEADKFFIDLSGSGEPLLNMNTIKFISNYAKNKSNEIKKEIIVNFVSNGLLLNKRYVDFLQSNSILFGVSIDGNKLNHDYFRKSKNINTFDLIIKNIENIENREYIGCAVTITNRVFDLVESLIFLKMYFKTISYKPVRSKQYGLDDISLKQWQNEYSKLCIFLKKELSNNDTSSIKCILNGDDFFGKFLLRCILKLKALNRCDAGMGRFSLSNDKNIYGCPALSSNIEAKIGNLDNGLDSSILKEIFSNSIKKSNKCLDCYFKFQCGGECLIELQENDNQPNEIMCQFKQILILLAMDLSLYLENLYDKKIYEEIYIFCIEKRNRYKKNKDLYLYLQKNPKLSFIDGKAEFDKENKKY